MAYEQFSGRENAGTAGQPGQSQRPLVVLPSKERDHLGLTDFIPLPIMLLLGSVLSRAI